MKLFILNFKLKKKYFGHQSLNKHIFACYFITFMNLSDIDIKQTNNIQCNNVCRVHFSFWLSLCICEKSLIFNESMSSSSGIARSFWWGCLKKKLQYILYYNYWNLKNDLKIWKMSLKFQFQGDGTLTSLGSFPELFKVIIPGLVEMQWNSLWDFKSLKYW